VTADHLGDISSVGASEPGDPVEGELWLDTSTSPDTLKRWDGVDTWEVLGTVHATWSGVVDDGHKPEDDATVGATWDVNIADQPDHFMQTFYQDAEPSGVGEDDGDLWVDTNDGNKLYRYVTDEWVEIQDADVATALANAGDAQATADGKVKTYAQATAPADDPAGTLAEGDLWIDTDDDNKMYRWDDTGESWEPYAYDVATWAKVVGRPADPQNLVHKSTLTNTRFDGASTTPESLVQSCPAAKVSAATHAALSPALSVKRARRMKVFVVFVVLTSASR